MHFNRWTRGSVDLATPGVRKLILRGGSVKKRKKKRFEAGKEARRRARASGLSPAATRIIPDKRKRPPKHKVDLLEET
jgi:hypothetical protein